MPDTFLKLFDSKGGLIKQNDDIKGEEGNLNSEFQFIPEVSGTYYISAGAYTGNLGSVNEGAYTVTVTEMVAGLPDPIDGTDDAMTSCAAPRTGRGSRAVTVTTPCSALAATTPCPAAWAMTCWSAAWAPIPCPAAWRGHDIL